MTQKAEFYFSLSKMESKKAQLLSKRENMVASGSERARRE